jgi:hypothetical protein
MRKLSLFAFASLLTLWGISSFLHRDATGNARMQEEALLEGNKATIFSRAKKHELDRIGEVINEKNVEIDHSIKEKIVSAKKEYDLQNDLREKEKLLEQSFTDQHSTIQDIKSIQSKILANKLKLKLEVKNAEKWEPGFVYYLMMNENYSYSDVNNIQSLSENGFNTEELNYISEVMRSKGFFEKIAEFKGQGEISRKIASSANPKEIKDEFVNKVTEEVPSAEDKIIEMNYSK